VIAFRNLWFLVVHRVKMAIAKAEVGSYILSSAGVGGCPPPVIAPLRLGSVCIHTYGCNKFVRKRFVLTQQHQLEENGQPTTLTPNMSRARASGPPVLALLAVAYVALCRYRASSNQGCLYRNRFDGYKRSGRILDEDCGSTGGKPRDPEHPSPIANYLLSCVSVLCWKLCVCVEFCELPFGTLTH
jgi:hypothetical protein